ncbi:FxLYD domain-containing protein [Chromobacterium vaccinii]|uniref:FxLYD domain-containing protein n=1 Tax=Chromobacterium vaccinii TaxID=1108595 RepID=A0ABV0FCE6_9NEIS
MKDGNLGSGWQPVRSWLSRILLAAAIATPCAQAAADAKPHLLFHMGVGGNGQFAVKGTIQNQGDQPVAHGYIVVSMRDKACRPIGDRLQTFDKVMPGQKLAFEVPVDGKLFSYHLTAFKAFDDMGFEIAASDDTLTIIQAREKQDRATCSKERSLAVK